MPRQLPTRIGRFDVIRRLGAGGMAVVYLARDPALGRTVAIKVLPEVNVELSQRFAREARSIAQLTHPNIVTIYDYGDDDGQPFIAMEYVEGETLGDFVRRQEHVSRTGLDDVGVKLHIFQQLSAGIGYAHRMGVIHRDIKPGNIMLTAENVVKILDFGLARITTEASSSVLIELTLPGVIMGTPHYMSPEQVEGRTADERSDIFAVGLLFYEVLTHRKAYFGDSAHAVLHRIVTTDPAPIRELCPDIDSDLEHLVNTAIRRSPEERYASVAEMIRDLDAIRARLTGSSRPPAPQQSAAGRRLVAGTKEPSPRYGFNVDSIARRRAAQIEQHLNDARADVKEGRFESAIHNCELLAAFDPEHAEMLELLDEAHRSIVARQVSDVLREAESQIDRGDFTQAQILIDQAMQLSPDSAEAKRLSVVLVERRREAERALRVQATLDRARSLAVEGAFEAVLIATDDIWALDASNPEASALRALALDGLERRRQQQREQAAHATVDKARQLMAVGDLTRALNILHAFTPAHAGVEEAIREITATRLARDEKHDAPMMVPPVEVVLDASSPLEVSPAWPTAVPDAPIGPKMSADPGTRLMRPPPVWEPDAGDDALSTPVAAVAPPAVSRLSTRLVASLAVVVVVVAIGIWWLRSSSPERAAVTAVASGPPPQAQAMRVERRLSVNAVPWASVRLVAAGGPDSSARQLTTPFTVVLPEGEYHFEFTHPLFGSVVRQVDLRETDPPPLVVTMPQANVEQILDDVLGKQ